MPADGKWDLYVALRPENDDAVGDATYANVGSYPPMNRYTPVRNGHGDSGYQYVKVPGGPFNREVNHETGIYIQSQTGKDTSAVLVDRIVAVRSQ